jgi:hypothetical protein
VKKLEGKCFARTGKGHMLLGPGGMKAGDSIFVLPGCRIPVVLRKESEHGTNSRGDEVLSLFANEDEDGDSSTDVPFKLVGECYVQGLMDGHALNGRSCARLMISIL